jgi:pimeloyl-ACP methyl ester carboxylesterase
MSPTMERVPVNGAELEVDVQGLGEPIVFIHGAGIADSFLPVAIDPAVRDHYRTIRYRRRGHGGSSPVDGPFSVSDHASDCRALLGARSSSRQWDRSSTGTEMEIAWARCTRSSPL